MPLHKLSAQSTSLQGYAKSLGIRSALPGTGTPITFSLNRLRTQVRQRLGHQAVAEVWLDTELWLGSLLRTDEYKLARDSAGTRPVKLDWTVTSSESVEIRQRLFRAFVTLGSGRAQATMGRQRIAWGTGFAWNPTDLLNPFNPGAIELGERDGVDALHGTLSLGPTSHAEVVIAAPERFKELSYAARAGTNMRKYDVTLMAGRFGTRHAIGGDFAGYLGGAGLRGEAAWVRVSDQESYLRAVVNADYTFSRGVYSLIEVYYNGKGGLAVGEAFGSKRWYGAVSLVSALSPLVGASVYGLANLSDGSVLCGPAVTVSLSQALELAASVYLFVGRGDTEFGIQRHAAFVALQWYY